MALELVLKIVMMGIMRCNNITIQNYASYSALE